MNLMLPLLASRFTPTQIHVTLNSNTIFEGIQYNLWGLTIMTCIP